MNKHQASNLLRRTLKNLRIKATVLDCEVVEPLYRFSLLMGKQEKVDRLETSAKEIAIQMRAVERPEIRPDYAGGIVLMDFMFGQHPLVMFEDVVALARQAQMQPGLLDICLGTTDIHNPLVRDLTQMPHLLLAGTTGSGKSTALHAIIKSLIEGVLIKPQVLLVLMDPKRVEFNHYKGKDDISVGHTAEECQAMLVELQGLMRRRLEVLAKKKCANIEQYNSRGYSMPYVVLMIDELADLVRSLKAKFTDPLCDIAEKSRAAGIHAVIATQDPRASVLTGQIKANFPARLVFRVSSAVHSRIALDRGGAEKLLGKGDAYLLDGELDTRLQGAWVDPPVVPEKGESLALRWWRRLCG